MTKSNKQIIVFYFHSLTRTTEIKILFADFGIIQKLSWHCAEETRKSGPSWRMNQFLRILRRRKIVFVCCSSVKCLKIVLQVRRSA